MNFYLQVLGGVGLVVTALVFARGTGRKVSSELWRDTAEAERGRREQLEKRVAEQDTSLAELRLEVDLLKRLVTGVHAIEELRVHMDARFDIIEMALRGR